MGSLEEGVEIKGKEKIPTPEVRGQVRDWKYSTWGIGGVFTQL